MVGEEREGEEREGEDVLWCGVCVEDTGWVRACVD